ncbi:MAG: Gfo/Idh/MocA family oxidoreductase [Clostridia bacterium]|nr:Gfo/Idh/MocA family oxidoreductase [Clostridia bacterium]
MTDKIRYGCVGAGGIAEYKHLNGYSKIDCVEISAICDNNTEAAKRLAEKYNIPNVFSDYKEMLHKTELDFISVCTPNFLHEPVTVEALKKGVHVHCEKPVALNSQEVQEMIKIKNLSGKKLMVALNNRFTNESYFVKKYIEEGYLGEIYHAKCGWRRKRGIPGKGGWFTNKELSGGGPLIDLGVHFLDLVMYFMGYPEASTVTGVTYSKFAENNSRNSWNYGKNNTGIYDVEDFAAGFIRLKNEATIDFEFNWASNIEKEYNYYELLGTKGGISFADGKLKLFSEVLDTCVSICPDTNYPSMAVNEFEHFIDCIRSDNEPVSTPEESLMLMKIIDGIYSSAEIKREIIL